MTATSRPRVIRLAAPRSGASRPSSRSPRCCRSCAPGAEETSRPRTRSSTRSTRRRASCPTLARRPRARRRRAGRRHADRGRRRLGASAGTSTCSPSRSPPAALLRCGRRGSAGRARAPRGRHRPRRRLFGAGTHPTTQLCLELLLELRARRRAVPTGAPGAGVLADRAPRGSASAPVAAVEVDARRRSRQSARNARRQRRRASRPRVAQPAPRRPRRGRRRSTANLHCSTLLAAIAADADASARPSG